MILPKQCVARGLKRPPNYLLRWLAASAVSNLSLGQVVATTEGTRTMTVPSLALGAITDDEIAVGAKKMTPTKQYFYSFGH